MAGAQTWTTPGLELRVKGLHFYTADSRNGDNTADLAAALQTVIANRDLCCGRNSTLVDSVGQVMPLSLGLAAAKIGGRKILPDGRPVIVDASYTPVQTENNPATLVYGKLLTALHHNQPLLMQWKSRVYVVYGAEITEMVAQSNDGSGVYDTIDKILLFDPATGQQTAFTSATDSLADVQGLLTVSVTPSSS